MRKFTISIFAATIMGAAHDGCNCHARFRAGLLCLLGTGNVSDEPLPEKTNGAYGYEMSVAPPASGKSAYACGRLWSEDPSWSLRWC
jgi:hypothetical protein